jgi:hypothetical protein
MPAPLNPTIQLEMSLETFNQMQRILARGRYDKAADLILNFRQQVGLQIEKLQAMQQMPPTRLRAVPDAEVNEDTA